MPRLQPFAGLYVLTMAILGPLFTANSEKIGARLQRRSRQKAAPVRRRDPMLDEEIALVQAATADQAKTTKSQTGAQRAEDRPGDYT